MKAKLIASILTLTTILSVGYPIASKAKESNNLVTSKIEVESSYNTENKEIEKEEFIVDSNVKEKEEVSTQVSNLTSTNNLIENIKSEEKVKENSISIQTQQDKETDEYNKVEEGMEPVVGWNNFFGELHYIKAAADGSLYAAVNSYVDGYYVALSGARTGEKCSTKVNSASEAISLIKSNHNHYFGEEDYTLHGPHERKEYKVESVRDELCITDCNMTDEPAYIVDFVGTETGAKYFSYAVGCYTGKVYMKNPGSPIVSQMENGVCSREYNY